MLKKSQQAPLDRLFRLLDSQRCPSLRLLNCNQCWYLLPYYLYCIIIIASHKVNMSHLWRLISSQGVKELYWRLWNLFSEIKGIWYKAFHDLGIYLSLRKLLFSVSIIIKYTNICKCKSSFAKSTCTCTQVHLEVLVLGLKYILKTWKSTCTWTQVHFKVLGLVLKYFDGQQYG